MMKKTIAVLLTCHNRKTKTLECLQALHRQKGMGVYFMLDVFLVDDGSSDGTASEIRGQFPNVHIIQGNGNLYWNRGMHLAWKTALNQKKFDYYLWLNDDTFLDEEALNTMLFETFKNAIICGTTQSVISQKPTYGGYLKKTNRLVVPNGDFQVCDYFNGNCVLISSEACQLVGNLDPVFHHAVGDFDYSLRAKKMGVNLFVAPKFIGICENHDFVPKWRCKSESVGSRLKFLYTASSGCYPPQFFVFDKRHNGLFLACVHFFSIHLRAVFPALWE